MGYRDNVKAFKRAAPDREGEFVEPDDFRVIRRINKMRTGYSENEREYLSNIITAEALVCVIDRLDRVIELLEERA
jgi:hypothetical protein